MALRYLAAAAVAALLIAAVWALTLERVRYERDDAIKDAIRENTTLALALEEHAFRTLKAVHQVLADIALEYREDGDKVDIPQLIREGVIDAHLFRFVGITDERGKIVLGSAAFKPTSLADLDVFRAPRAADGRDMQIGLPMIDRVVGEWVIPVSRRITRADGSFAGVAYAGIDPYYFGRFYGKARLGEKTAVSLVGADGIARIRYLGGRTWYGDDMNRGYMLMRERAKAPNGAFVSSGRTDGLRRLISYRTLSAYPVIVELGTPETEALAEFEKRRGNYYTAAALTTVLLMLCAVAAAWAMRRQQHHESAHRYAQAALTESEARFRQVAENISEVFWLTDPGKNEMLYVSAAYEAIWQRSRESIYRSPRAWLESIHPEDRERVLEAAVTKQAIGDYNEEYRIVRPDGSTRWVQDRAFPVRDRDGRVVRIAGVAQDVTERRRAVAAMRESQEQFEQLARHIPEVFWITDAERGELVYLSPAYERVSGRRLASLAEAWDEWKAAIHPEDREHALAAYRAMFEIGLDHEFRIVRPDGSMRWVHVRGYHVRNEKGEIHRVAGTVEDITERRDMRARLEHQAYHDALTGLPNRALCFDRLDHAIQHAKRKKWNVSFMFIDLDRFKAVNDTLGHEAGDQVLLAAAQRLAGTVRRADTVARTGGDVFSVVLSDVARSQDAALVANKILKALAPPFRVNGQDVFLTASIGIASYPSDGDRADEIVKNADAAVFQAKLRGRNNHQFYAADLNARAMEKLRLEGKLRQALERDEFVLHFQPKMELATGRLIGTEALLRWRVSENELIAPGVFIPVLEESGLIVPVGAWVLEAACRQARAWRDAGLDLMPIAVNLSAKQFRRQDIVATVKRALDKAAIDPALLELEITESAAMENPEEAAATLTELRRLGVRLSIDDFGTGYSSLSYLKRFPLDSLKIDRSFVTGLPGDNEDVSIARAVIAMAHSLEMRVIAEGVETEAQERFLAIAGCDEMQGFHLSRPLPASELAAWAAARRPATHGPRRRLPSVASG